MAVKTFESIYSSLSAGEKQIIDNLFAKEPELKAGWLRQDDFSRRQNDFKAKETRLTELEAYEETMKPWAAEAHTRIKRLEEAGVLDAEGNELWTAQKADLERKVAAAAVGGEVDPAELERRVQDIVKQSGGVTKDELNALIRNESQKLMAETFDSKYKEVETNFNQKTIPTVAGFAAGVAVFAAKYEKETGEVWTSDKAKELFELMGKENNFDAYQVGDKMLEPVRQKKQSEEEVERRVRERMKAMGVPEGGDDRFLPQNVNAQKGALQAMLERSAESGGDKPMDLDLVVKTQVNKAAESLRSEGKF